MAVIEQVAEECSNRELAPSVTNALAEQDMIV